MHAERSIVAGADRKEEAKPEKQLHKPDSPPPPLPREPWHQTAVQVADSPWVECCEDLAGEGNLGEGNLQTWEYCIMIPGGHGF